MTGRRRAPGAEGFNLEYWLNNYQDPEQMDCYGNASAHAAYIKSTFDVVYQPIESVVDLGFGLGKLFEEVLVALKPYKALGIDPSPYAHKASTDRLRAVHEQVRLETTDLRAWCERPEQSKTRFDLGLCTSVLQYVSAEDLDRVVPVLARRVKYLYLTVPTETELVWQRKVEAFDDAYAFSRPRSWYRELFSEHFTVVGARMLESKVLVGEAKSKFTDHLFRWE